MDLTADDQEESQDWMARGRNAGGPESNPDRPGQGGGRDGVAPDDNPTFGTSDADQRRALASQDGSGAGDGDE